MGPRREWQVHEFLSVYLEEKVSTNQREQRRYELTKMLTKACEDLEIETVLEEDEPQSDSAHDPTGWYREASEWLKEYQDSVARPSSAADDAKALVRQESAPDSFTVAKHGDNRCFMNFSKQLKEKKHTTTRTTI